MRSDKDAVEWAKRMMGQPFVVLDLETTTTNFKHIINDEIVQIAIIDHNGEALLNNYVKPTVKIPNSRYHGITDEMVADAPTFPELYERIMGFLSDQPVIIYNAGYDTNILTGVVMRHNLPGRPVGTECHCAMTEFAAFYGEWHDYFQSYTFKSLSVAMKYLHLEWAGKEHDALADCLATLEVVKAMAAVETEKPDLSA